MFPEAGLAAASLLLAPRIDLLSAPLGLRAGTLSVNGSINNFPRCVPPRMDRTLRVEENPGTVQRPPGLENAASSRRNGHPRNVAVPVKYCAAAISSATFG